MNEVVRFVIPVDTVFVFLMPHKVFIIVKQDENMKYHIFSKKVFKDPPINRNDPSIESMECTQEHLTEEEYIHWVNNAFFAMCHRNGSPDDRTWLNQGI